MNRCPFCGSDEVGPAYNQHVDGHGITMICCSHYGATGPVRTYKNQWDDEEAEAAWNIRHNVQNHRPARLFAQDRWIAGLAVGS